MERGGGGQLGCVGGLGGDQLCAFHPIITWGKQTSFRHISKYMLLDRRAYLKLLCGVIRRHNARQS